MTVPLPAAAENPGLPQFVIRAPSGFYRSLNPATKLSLAAVEVVAAFVIPGWLGPGLVIAVVLVTAASSRTLRSLVVIGLAALPLVVSIMVVNLFLLPGAFGPHRPDWASGADLERVLVRPVDDGSAARLLIGSGPRLPDHARR